MLIYVIARCVMLALSHTCLDFASYFLMHISPLEIARQGIGTKINRVRFG